MTASESSSSAESSQVFSSYTPPTGTSHNSSNTISPHEIRNPGLTTDDNIGPSDELFSAGLYLLQFLKETNRIHDKEKQNERLPCADVEEEVSKTYHNLKNALINDCRVVHGRRCSRLVDLMGELEIEYRPTYLRCHRGKNFLEYLSPWRK